MAMPPDATETKKRLLQAAYAEFAEKGLAGARIDQISARAGANKRLIYLHFGDKETLFDLVVAKTLQEMSVAVPFTENDVTHYAGALFDYLVAHPEVLRLTSWANLERPRATPEEVDAYRPKITAIAQAQQRGVLTDTISAQHLLAIVLGSVTAWASASPALRHFDDSADPIAASRDAAVNAVHMLTASTTSPA